MADPRTGADHDVLFLTTRDVADPRTGADNRAKYLYSGIDRVFDTDLVHFARGEGLGGDTATVSVPYPPTELLALVSIRFLLAVVRLVRRRDYDVVVVSGIGAVTYGLVATRLSRAALVFDDHNVEHELARDTSLPRYGVVYLLERLACRTAALVVVPTASTAAALDRWTRGGCAVVTNGFDAATFTPDGPAVDFDGRTLLFFGNFAYEPNRTAVDYLVEELCPRLESTDLEATVRVAGPGIEALPAATQRPDSMELLGFVEDLPATIRGADLVVVPLDAGSGSRLKIIESLACGTPVVSTPIGAEGWPTEWDNLVLAELESFAATALDVLEDRTFDRAELDAYAAYSWQAQSVAFVDAIRRIAGPDD
jgi:glycosyltransferase involved in cell wall biosynthesis